MKQSNFKWKLDSEKFNEENSDIAKTMKQLNISPKLLPLIHARGIQSPEEVQTFFQPQIEDLYDPFFLHDMEKVVERVQRAVQTQEKIVIYGDYDADGITSTCLMKEAIELLGAEAEFYLPDRFKDGYGPNLNVFRKLIEENGAQLIITVDNGVAGHEALSYAKEKGVDVIVTDHHEIPPTLPEAYGIIHPRHPRGSYPFGDLAGVGVAFKVATALLGEVPQELLDLVAIGTIADLVSLTGENRILTKIGLKWIQQTDRIGLVALCKKAGVTVSEITEKDIGYAIAPRLNALGRLGDATPGIELLTTFDDEKALELADFTQKQNEIRQKIVKKTTEEALEMILEESNEENFYVLAKEEWHEGILGIVASRIVQETGRPTLILSLNKETNMAKGSGRSIEDINLFEMLNENRTLFQHFGGHHMAVGLTLPIEEIATLKKIGNDYVCNQLSDSDQKMSIEVEDFLSISETTVDFIDSLAKLAPYGTDNPLPYFLFRPTRVSQVKKIGGNQTHLKFQIGEGTSQLDCIGFNMGEYSIDFTEGSQVTLVGQLEINEWNGNRKAQLVVKDFEIEEVQLFDIRGDHFPETLSITENAVALIFSEDSSVADSLPDSIQKIYFSQIESISEDQTQFNEVILVDCPDSLDDLKYMLARFKLSRVYLWGYSKEKLYLNGMPSRNEFSTLFNFIKQYDAVDVRYKLKDISNFLKIKVEVLTFMIKVFAELNFVTLQDGVMKKVAEPESHALTESLVYQKREQKMKIEEFLLYSDSQQIKKWMLQEEKEC